VDIENAILRYGLNYAKEFVRRLDVRCEEMVNSPQIVGDLNDQREEKLRRRKELEAEIDEARRRCISERGSKSKVKALYELYNKLYEDIRLSAEIEIIEQQIQILNRLSLGESGILDIYRRKISELADRVRRQVEGSEEQQGLDDLYLLELPKRFLKTREDVTTTYLPDVATFVESGGWKKDHLFARLYGGIVRQHTLPGGREEPLRYGEDYGRSPDRQGLHRILWEILTSPEYTNMERGYEEHGHTNFFRRFFGQEASLEATTIISLIERFATNYIRLAMERDQDVKNELNRNMAERFNNLSDEERRLIKSQFDDRGTQTFCPMNILGSERPTTYNVWAGNDEKLAEELGYMPNERTHQFIQDNVPNRFIKIKVLTRHTLDMYPHYSLYKSLYDRLKQQYQDFVPHIHKLFNQLGVSRGLNRICQATDEGLLDGLTRMLLYREMFETAFNDNRDLVEEIIYIDEELLGNERTYYSPLIIESVGGRRVALVCNKIEMAGNRLKLTRKNYIVVSANAQHYKAIYDGIKSLPDLPFLDVLNEFDQHFKKNCSVSWLYIIEEASSSLLGKVRAGLGKLERGDVHKFYEDLNNSLITVSRSFKEEIEKIIDRSSRAIAETKPEVEKEGEGLPL
jgi:hypothetical protein